MTRKEQQIASVLHDLVALTMSPLYGYRHENGYVPVVGDGNLDARIVFIGEAPGRREAETGKPFVGAAGKFLDGMLSSVGISRSDVYITNIVNDRPPGNRDPKPDELQLYSPFLERVLDIIRPRVIVTLGRFSMRYILAKYNAPEAELPIGTLHGKSVRTAAPYGEVTIIPLYHPAAALYNGSLKAVLQEDFRVLAEYRK
jgi:uracil-DNA glycosylase family 4